MAKSRMGLAAIGMMALLCMPFGGPMRIISLYKSTMSSYPYASVNAYNFWAMLGRNYISQDGTLLFMSCRSWGTLSIIAAVALSAMHFFSAKGKANRYYTTAVLLIICVFLFSVRMHERYNFPDLIMLLAAYVVNTDEKLYGIFLAESALQLYNIADVFLYYRFIDEYTALQMTIPYRNQTAMRIVSAATVLIGCGYVYSLFRSCSKSGRLKADNK